MAKFYFVCIVITSLLILILVTWNGIFRCGFHVRCLCPARSSAHLYFYTSVNARKWDPVIGWCIWVGWRGSVKMKMYCVEKDGRWTTKTQLPTRVPYRRSQYLAVVHVRDVIYLHAWRPHAMGLQISSEAGWFQGVANVRVSRLYHYVFCFNNDCNAIESSAVRVCWRPYIFVQHSSARKSIKLSMVSVCRVGTSNPHVSRSNLLIVIRRAPVCTSYVTNGILFVKHISET